MDVKEAINKRRAYRSLKRTDISDDLIKDLALNASLAPSCFNKQPWRFIFIREQSVLEKVFATLSPGNNWAEYASMVIAVFSKPELDCQIKERDYFLFDTGMAVALLQLRATELGLVAHPIAGFDSDKAKKVLDIPEDHLLITFIIVGEKTVKPASYLNEKQIKGEENRPPRKQFEQFAWLDGYSRTGAD